MIDSFQKVVEENLELSTIDKTIEEVAQNEKTRDGGLTSDKKVTEKEVYVYLDFCVRL